MTGEKLDVAWKRALEGVRVERSKAGWTIRVPSGAAHWSLRVTIDPKKGQIGFTETVGAVGQSDDAEIELGRGLSYLGRHGGTCLIAERVVGSFLAKMVETRPGLVIPDDLVNGMKSKVAEVVSPVADDVMSHLNADAIHSLRAVEDFNWQVYEFYAEESELGHRRRQAAESYPILAEYMARKLGLRSGIGRDGFRLKDEIIKSFGKGADGSPVVSSAVIDRLNRVDVCLPIDTICGNGRFIQMVDRHLTITAFADILGDLPPDWIPKGAAEWQAFCDFATVYAFILKDSIGVDVKTLTAGCGGKWVEFRERLAKALTDTRPPLGLAEEDAERLRSAIDMKALGKSDKTQVPRMAREMVSRLTIPEGVSKEAVSGWITRQFVPEMSLTALWNACFEAELMVQSFADQVILPFCAAQSGQRSSIRSGEAKILARKAAANVLCGGKSLPAIFEVSRKYATMKPKIDTEVADSAEARRNAIVLANIPTDGWSPMFLNDIMTPQGLRVVCLYSESQLKEEGAALEHCVGGYANTCRNGGHILSLRRYNDDGSFTRVSTVEIERIPHGEKRFNVRQNYGRHNKFPGQPAVDAIKWVQDMVMKEQIAINHDGIKSYSTNLYGPDVDAVSIACGYDWSEPENLKRASIAWNEFKSKKYRSMRIAEFMADPDIAVLISYQNSGIPVMMKR
jgi:hypothetical protein